MPGVGQRVAIGVSAAAMAAVLLTGFEPPHSADVPHGSPQQPQQPHDDLPHSDEPERAGEEAGEGDYSRRLVPGEYRPPGEIPDLHVRVLP